MKAMILAAGYGTRLRPLTYLSPKPVVPVCNRPLISYAVEAFLRSGIREIVVNLHHLPDQIEALLSDRYRGEADFRFSREPEILGTGGGVRKVRSTLEGDDHFFLVNADTIQFPRYESLKEARRSIDGIAALTLRHPPAGDRFTPVFLDQPFITGFGSGHGEALMFSGAHCISRRVFDYLPDKPFSGIVDEVYQPLIDSGRERLGAVVDDGLWFDIGTPARYMAASRSLLEATVQGAIEVARGSRIAGDSVVSESARISGTVTGSSVGSGTVVEGAISDSVLWDDCHVAPGVTLNSCVVGAGVSLTRVASFQDMIICRDDPSVIPRDAGYAFADGLAMMSF